MSHCLADALKRMRLMRAVPVLLFIGILQRRRDSFDAGFVDGFGNALRGILVGGGDGGGVDFGGGVQQREPVGALRIGRVFSLPKRPCVSATRRPGHLKRSGRRRASVCLSFLSTVCARNSPTNERNMPAAHQFSQFGAGFGRAQAPVDFANRCSARRCRGRGSAAKFRRG